MVHGSFEEENLLFYGLANFIVNGYGSGCVVGLADFMFRSVL